MECYGLDRFSEDIDLDCLDGCKGDIRAVVESYCSANGFSYRVAKETDTVKRYMVNYGNQGKPLKIETSFRDKSINKDNVKKIKGITVYDIDTICSMKALAYSSRDKIRDLYDLTFICNIHFDKLSSHTVGLLKNAIAFKGIEQFDYLMKSQKDELIDENKLADGFLAMYDKLGLLYDENESSIIEEIKNGNSFNKDGDGDA